MFLESGFKQVIVNQTNLLIFSELCLKNINSLAEICLITMDEDINFKPTGKALFLCQETCRHV